VNIFLNYENNELFFVKNTESEKIQKTKYIISGVTQDEKRNC